MSPIIIILILVWSITLLVIGISAVLYTQAEKVQDELDILSVPKPLRAIERVTINTRNTVKKLSNKYAADVKDLFHKNPRSKEHG